MGKCALLEAQELLTLLRMTADMLTPEALINYCLGLKDIHEKKQQEASEYIGGLLKIKSAIFKAEEGDEICRNCGGINTSITHYHGNYSIDGSGKLCDNDGNIEGSYCEICKDENGPPTSLDELIYDLKYHNLLTPEEEKHIKHGGGE